MLDSPTVQRLRDIHQLGLTYLLYPGASHKRFEHSLGVMHVAGRIYDVAVEAATISPFEQVRQLVEENATNGARDYWRLVVRIAALLHDIGHMPFSHGSEDLLPEGMKHEDLTRKLITEDETINQVFKEISKPRGIDPEHVLKLALGETKLRDKTFSQWERILSEMITGDEFGADRIDYLIRDSHHTGVAYGRFDHYRLIDSLRLLPEDEKSDVVVLGVDEGGIHSAEALLLARYFMFLQVYMHPVRQAYDQHLVDFLKQAIGAGELTERHQQYTDNEVLSILRVAAADEKAPGHRPAKLISKRHHFHTAYRRNPDDLKINRDAIEIIYEKTAERYGKDNVSWVQHPNPKAEKKDKKEEETGSVRFPVEQHGQIVSSSGVSEVLIRIPPIADGYVFVEKEKAQEAEKWIRENKSKFLKVEKE